MADATLNEIRQRLTRVESRVCRIAEFLGARVENPRKELFITRQTEDAVDITTPALDVAVSDILAFLHKEGIEGKLAYVYFHGQLAAIIQ